MRPKDLKAPFPRQAPRILLEDRVLYAPPRLAAYPRPFSAWGDLFENQRPIKVELCSGNGDWVTTKAVEEPETNWVAVEKRFDRVRKIWSKMKNRDLSNLWIVCGEAITALSNFFDEASVALVAVNFPDPWPKTRHAKHRLVRGPFLEQAARVLVAGGELVVVTDDPPYRDQAIQELSSHGAFLPVGAAAYKSQWVGYGDSWFGRLWRRRGKAIAYLHYQLTGNGVVKETPLVGEGKVGALVDQQALVQ